MTRPKGGVINPRNTLENDRLFIVIERKQTGRVRVTLKDLARDLGMSVSTVSRAFDPDAVIAVKTRQAVLKRAAALEYRPNPFARSLITNKTQIVGVVVSDLTNPFYPEVMTNLTGLLREAGMNVMLAAADQPDKIDDAVELLLMYQPDLIIVLATHLASRALAKCEQAGAPCIFFNRLSSNGQGFGVSCDNEAGGRIVADYLIDQGHRSLAYVSAFSDASTNVERQRGFCERAIARELEPPQIITAGEFTYEAGYAAGHAAADLPKDIDGIFCANDIVAIGVIDGLKEARGVRVPDDVSVIGFDNIAMAGWASHRLTTVAQPVNEMIAATVELARKLTIDHHLAPHIMRLPPGTVIERSTTRERIYTEEGINDKR